MSSEIAMQGDRRHQIAVISSIPPDPNRIAGALILSRWLDHPQIDWTYIELPTKPKSILWKILDRLTRTRYFRIASPLKKFYESNAVAVMIDRFVF
jgi:hypothetical protein